MAPRSAGNRKAKGLNQPLKISSLIKVWHKFILYNNNRYVLAGSYSQTHKRFRLKTNGMQGSCNCVVACVMANLFKMEQWDFSVLNQILNLGDKLYEKSIMKMGDHSLGALDVTQIYPTLYISRCVVNFQILNPKEPMALAATVAEDRVGALTDTLTVFLKNHTFGIMKIEQKHIAVWRYDHTNFLFDPTEHQKDGEEWNGLVSMGVSICVRFPKVRTMAEFIVHHDVKGKTLKVMMWPLEVVRSQMLSLKAPVDLEEVKRRNEKEESTEMLQTKDFRPVRSKAKNKNLDLILYSNDWQVTITHEIILHKDEAKKEDDSHPVHKNSEKMLETLRRAEEVSSDLEVQAKGLKGVEKSKIPVIPHSTKSITHFTELEDGTMGIIRGKNHQMDQKFSKFKDGEQSLSQAVAALVVRRSAPTRRWIKKFVDDILKLGETIQHESLTKEDKKETPKGKETVEPSKDKKSEATKTDKTEIPKPKEITEPSKDKKPEVQSTYKKLDGPFGLSNIVDKIVHPPGEYSISFEELVLLGKLGSDREGVLDLLPALTTVLKTYDCCIINGPITVAVWYEDNRYYMYDPNERDENGRSIDKTKKDAKSGVACVTWFSSLKDLVKLYLENLPKELKRNDFHLSKVEVVDYVDKPDNWNNFQGILKNKWILRGTMSQGSHVFPSESRNTQCTANAAMAIAFLNIRELKKWSKNTIDQILMSGDEFYRATIERLKESQNFVNKMLMVDELNRNFSFSKKEVVFDIIDCCVNGMLGYPDVGDVLNIKRGLLRFFEEFDYGILTCRNISVAVWKTNDAYYYFDSHGLDEKGFTSGYGTACVIRVLTVDELAKTIETNMKPDKLSYFNISAVNVKLLEDTGGKVRLPLNNFKQLKDNKDLAILLAKSSCKNKKYEFNAGKQTVPMCVAALGMNRLRPSSGWNADTLDVIMEMGHKYFEDCMAEYEASNEEVEEDKGITSKNLLQQFKIGLNRIELNLEQLAEGFVDGLANAITDFYTTNDTTNEQDYLEILVETENITVAVWKDQNLFYVFDPSPRDANGQVIGKDTWSAMIEIPVTNEANVETAKKPEEINPAPEMGAGDLGAQENMVEKKRPRSSGEGVFDEDPAEPTEADANGKACVLFFYNLEDVVKHILENTRPNKRSIMPFTINKVNINNVPLVKDIYDKELGERKDKYSGDWHSFVELDHGHWILRGQTDLNSEMFSEENRGKQEYPCIISALAFAKLYAMSKMQPHHLTSILCYGDRMLTCTKRLRSVELSENKTLNLLEEEIKQIIKSDHYEIEAYPRSFVIGDTKMTWTIGRDFLLGETTAKTNMDILDLKRALDELFQSSPYGIIECKGYSVAVWKGSTVFYMFDPHKTGVTGVRSTIGYPSITRFLTTDLLADTYLQNIPKDGLNVFCIHRITMNGESYQRSKDVMEQASDSKPIKISGFSKVTPGKYILRGSYSQGDPKFGKGDDVLSAPVAYIALTMSLIHKPETWSKPIVDEVLSVSDELYNRTVIEESPEFNPWKDSMDPYTVPKDFRVGVLQANLQIRKTDQKGILDTKDPLVLNLRQGLERFFTENTHGIIYSPQNVCLAIWEEKNKGLPILYMFDPNKRDPTGLPSTHGVACVMTFGSPKVAADHILSCIQKPEEKLKPFTIIPVEIIVGPFRTSKRKISKTKPKTGCSEDGQNMTKKLVRRDTIRERKIAKKKGSKKFLSQRLSLCIQAKEQKEKECLKKRFWQGRTGYFELPKCQSILRGTRCLTSSCYQEKTRGFQDIPVCIAAFVANSIVSIDRWTWKEIDSVLDTGDQLYIDSYIAYGPRNKKLGLENVIRNFFIMNNKARVTIFKPITLVGFNVNQLTRNFDKWFLDENFCMLNYEDQWVGVFFKKGYYFMFDPHGRGETGCRAGGRDVAACVLRFEKLVDLARKLVNNLRPREYEYQLEREDEEKEEYELVLVRLEEGVSVEGKFVPPWISHNVSRGDD